jgi:hypothetical protein
MTVGARTAESRPASAGSWYARSPDEAAAALGVDPAVGLSAERAACLLADNGPNAAPEEKPEPFTPAQVPWIKETPGLMALRPRRRGESVLTTEMMVTVGVAGLAIAIGQLSAEFVLAVLVTQMYVFNRLLGTTRINLSGHHTTQGGNCHG